MLLPAYFFAYSRAAAWFMVGFIFLISALRYNVGFDYEVYFDWARLGIDSFSVLSIEPLSKEILDLALYSGEPQLFFVISSLIIVGLFGYSYIRSSQLPALSILAFFCLPLLFLVSLTVIRQSMAAAVVFYALTVHEDRKKSAFVLLLLSGLLHYSAWIMIPIWLLMDYFDRPLRTRWYLAALITAPIFSLVLLELVLPFVPFYFYYIEIEGGSGLKLVVLYYLLAFLVLWFHYRGVALPRRPLNYFMLGVLLFVATVPVNEVLGRIAYFFMPFGALLLPSCIAKIRPLALSRFLVVLLLGCLFLMQLFIASQHSIQDPYQPYLLYPEWF
jgi:hypothetical protein